MEAKEPAGPPELPKGTTPQLVRSTKSTLPSVEPDDEAVLEPDPLNEHVEEPGDPDGVHAAEMEQIWQARHDEAEAPMLPEKKRRWPIVLMVLLLLAGAGGAAYWFVAKKPAVPAAKSPVTATKTSRKTSTDTAPSVPTKHYDSTIYTLGFDYPQTWTVSDTSTKLTVISPAISLATVSGTDTQGHAIVTVQNPQTTLPGFPASGAVAVLASQKLTYKQPTAVQRAQTYLSYLSYQKPDGLDALYITGDNGYPQGQLVPQADVAKGNPLVSVTFATCTDATCSTGTPTPLTMQAGKWAGTALSKQLVDLLQSMQLN